MRNLCRHCPVDAIDMTLFSDEQILAQIRAATAVKGQYPFIVGFLCNWCSYAGADLAGTSRISTRRNMRAIRVMCAGRSTLPSSSKALRAGRTGS